MKQSFFLYARKSSESEERQALSIEAQLAELKIFAERERLTIKEIFTESQSAKQPGRPVFNQMISRMEKGEANGIIAARARAKPLHAAIPLSVRSPLMNRSTRGSTKSLCLLKFLPR